MKALVASNDGTEAFLLWGNKVPIPRFCKQNRGIGIRRIISPDSIIVYFCFLILLSRYCLFFIP